MRNRNNPYGNIEPWHLAADAEGVAEKAYAGRKYVNCLCCGRRMYYENEFFEQDPCYQIGDVLVCENCVRDYIESSCRLVLEDRRDGF